MNQINVDKEYYKGLKEKYREAKEAGEMLFTYKDNEYYVKYAKYLIEYIETRKPEWKDEE